MLLFKRIAYIVWCRCKRHITVEEYIRWHQRAYPPGVDAPSAALFRKHPVLVDLLHSICWKRLRAPATFAGKAVLVLIHSTLPGTRNEADPSSELVYREIRRLEVRYPYASHALLSAALVYEQRGWRE